MGLYYVKNSHDWQDWNMLKIHMIGKIGMIGKKFCVGIGAVCSESFILSCSLKNKHWNIYQFVLEKNEQMKQI